MNGSRLFITCKALDYKQLRREFLFVSLSRVLLGYLNNDKIIISLGNERTACEQVRGYLSGQVKKWVSTNKIIDIHFS